MTDLITQIREDMAAGTQGPWKVDFWQVTTDAPIFGRRTHGYGCDNDFICDLNDGEYHEYVNGEEQEANARRIARVPQLEDMVLAQPDIDAKKDARIAELEAALAPFADAADDADEWGSLDESAASVTVGECRAARAALHQKEAET